MLLVSTLSGLNSMNGTNFNRLPKSELVKLLSVDSDVNYQVFSKKTLVCLLEKYEDKHKAATIAKEEVLAKKEDVISDRQVGYSKTRIVSTFALTAAYVALCIYVAQFKEYNEPIVEVIAEIIEPNLADKFLNFLHL